MGRIVYWSIIRTAILIPSLWIMMDYFHYKYSFAVTILCVYGVIIHPAVIQYRIFRNENKRILTDTLCGKCKHFDESAVLCMKLDIHPSEEVIPCNGLDWESIK